MSNDKKNLRRYKNNWPIWLIIIFSIFNTTMGIGLFTLIPAIYLYRKYSFIKDESLHMLDTLEAHESVLASRDEEYNNLLKDFNSLKKEHKKLDKEYDQLKSTIVENQEKDKDLLEKYNISLIDPYKDDDELPDSHSLKNQLTLLKMREKEIKEVKTVIEPHEDVSKRHHNTQVRQLLRLFNVESDLLFNKLTVKNFETTHNKIVKSYEALNKLFEIDGVKINEDLLLIKLETLYLMHKYEIVLEQEKEIRKEERERIAEEKKAEAELAKRKEEIEKEERQFNNEVSSLMAKVTATESEVEKQLYATQIQDLQEKIKQLSIDKENVDNRLLNTRAGYVYVISNIGSFGENIFKIGVTRRLDPYERIKELSSASVPFEFDIHAMIFAEDAPKLESTLHKHFKEHNVNKVNPRKEFFNINLNDIEKVVKEEYNNTVNFKFEADASQYRETVRLSS